MSNRRGAGYLPGMITRGDLLLLGISAGVYGSITGGLLLGFGLYLITTGSPAGWLLLLPGAPAASIAGWILARRLAKRTGIT